MIIIRFGRYGILLLMKYVVQYRIIFYSIDNNNNNNDNNNIVVGTSDIIATAGSKGGWHASALLGLNPPSTIYDIQRHPPPTNIPMHAPCSMPACFFFLFCDVIMMYACH